MALGVLFKLENKVRRNVKIKNFDFLEPTKVFSDVSQLAHLVPLFFNTFLNEAVVCFLF